MFPILEASAEELASAVAATELIKKTYKTITGKSLMEIEQKKKERSRSFPKKRKTMVKKHDNGGKSISQQMREDNASTDLTYANPAVATDLLYNISLGNEYDQRQGNSIAIKGFRLRYSIENFTTGGTYNSFPVFVRVMVVYSPVERTVTDFPTNPGAAAFYQFLTSFGRAKNSWRILYDKTHSLEPNVAQQRFVEVRFTPCKAKIKWVVEQNTQREKGYLYLYKTCYGLTENKSIIFNRTSIVHYDSL